MGVGSRVSLCLAFFLSGLAGLIYEVIWVRQFGNAFGNTIESAALVTACLMAGLGLGALGGGIVADRYYRPRDSRLVIVYAALELGVGLAGIALALAWPRLELLSAGFSSYSRGADGWYALSAGSYLFRYALASVFIFPIGLAMGATLPVLIKLITDGSGFGIGLLYGLNTLGASVGALLVDAFLIPHFGLFTAQLCAALANALAAIVAGITLARTAAVRRKNNATAAAPAPEREARTDSSAHKRIAGALLASGFVAMGLQMLWFRQLSGVVGGYRSVFSVLLAVILLALALGSWVGGCLTRRVNKPARLYLASQALLAVAAGACFALSYGRDDRPRQLAHLAEALSHGHHVFYEYSFLLRHCLRLTFLPALLLGLSYPVANAMIQSTASRIGIRAGGLYLANTIGAVAGSLVTGFILLPRLGVQMSWLVLALCILAGLALLARPLQEKACFALVAVAIVGWCALPRSMLLAKTYPPLPEGQGKYLTTHEGLLQSLAVVESPDGARVLKTNGHAMSGTDFQASRYMRAFVHLPLLQLTHPERVLVICFGVGNTLHAASLYRSVRELEIADLSRDILERSSWFAATNHNVLTDPRVSVFVNDGRMHLRMQAEDRYDLITLEPPPISYAGVASLYSEEFYRLARSRLKTGGFMTQWLPYFEVPESEMLSIIRSFIEVFPNATLHGGSLGDLILVGRKDAPNLAEPSVVEAGLRANPAVAADLQAMRMRSPLDFFGSYVGSARSLEKLMQHAPAVTDDDPLLEHSVIAVLESRLPTGLIDASGIATWCPACRISHLDAYASILAKMYNWHPVFSEVRDSMHTDPRPFIPRSPEYAATVKASDYLTFYWTH